MKNRHVLVIEGSSEQLERIIALFEAEAFNDTSTVKILDIGIAAIAPSSIEPVDLYRMWLDSLWHKGFQPAVRSVHATATNKKAIHFKHISIEIAIAIVELEDEDEIQIFLQIRPVHGKGYLPAGLKVAILDDLDEIVLQKSAGDGSNLLDLTEDGDLICQLNDRFKVSLSLGDEIIVESFPR